MADDFRLDETLRRAMDANLRYYQALGRITADYLEALTSIWSSALPLDLGTLRVPLGGKRGKAATAQAAPTREPDTTPALVLEADAGQEARGIFMVDNSLGRPVSTTVTVTAFRSETGAEATPALRIEPAVVALEPGTSGLVQLIATVPETLEPGVSYRAEVDVPGLSVRGIPVVLRRRPSAATPAEAPDSSAARTTADSELEASATTAAVKASGEAGAATSSAGARRKSTARSARVGTAAKKSTATTRGAKKATGGKKGSGGSARGGRGGGSQPG